MTKYLVLIAVVFAVVWYIRNAGQVRARQSRHAERPVQDMVRCAHCGVFQPRPDSIEAGGRFFCSQEHERLH